MAVPKLARDLFAVAEDLKTLMPDAAKVVGDAGTFVEDFQESLNQGWVMVEKVGDEYPPKELSYRGGLYSYRLVE
jgi:hypothetical protein